MAATSDQKPHRTKAKAAYAVPVSGSIGRSSARGYAPGQFVDVYRADPLSRVNWIKTGLDAKYLDRLSIAMKMPKERLLSTLGIAPATLSRRVRDAKPLSVDDSARAIGMARLVGQVQAMVEESGDPTGFNAAEWLTQWMEMPLAALGGQRPADFMDTSEGQAMVSNVLARMQSGAYA